MNDKGIWGKDKFMKCRNQRSRSKENWRQVLWKAVWVKPCINRSKERKTPPKNQLSSREGASWKEDISIRKKKQTKADTESYFTLLSSSGGRTKGLKKKTSQEWDHGFNCFHTKFITSKCKKGCSYMEARDPIFKFNSFYLRCKICKTY